MDISELQVEIRNRHASSVRTPLKPNGTAVPSHLRLADAVLEDVDAVAKIHVDSWRAAYRDYVPAALLDSITIEQRSAMWTRSIDPGYAGARVVVAHKDGDPAGFVAFGPLRGASVGIGEIYSLYVAPSAFRAGTGRALLEFAMDDLRSRSMRESLLWVLADNAPARSFYHKLGWNDTSHSRTEHLNGTPLREVQMRVNFLTDS